MFNRPVVFVDIETTGIGWRSSRIIEIAAVRYEDGQITDQFHSLINPGTYLPEHITSITGISDKDLAGQPFFEDVAIQLQTVVDDAIFIAHNVRFDYSFIKHQLESMGRYYKPDLLCTVKLSRYLYPKHRRHNLENIIKNHGINTVNRHRALDDALVMLEFCQKAYQEHGDKFNTAVCQQLKRRSAPSNLPAGLLDNLPDHCGVYIFEDSDGKPLYIGKSINIKKRVLSHFSNDNKFDKEMKISLGIHNIRTIETNNELEALILESKLVKEMLPLHNSLLRKVQKYTAIIQSETPEGYTKLSIEPIDIQNCEDFSKIYGLFTTKGKAKNTLMEHQKTFSLCSKLLGLEKTSGKCFHAQLGRCRGACSGQEPPASYNLRVDLALERTKLRAWPYKDSVVVRHKESPDKGIVVDQWRIIGEVSEEGIIQYTEDAKSLFDLDIYKILSSYLRTKKDLLLISPLASF